MSPMSSLTFNGLTTSSPTAMFFGRSLDSPLSQGVRLPLYKRNTDLGEPHEIAVKRKKPRSLDSLRLKPEWCDHSTSSFEGRVAVHTASCGTSLAACHAAWSF